MAASTLAFPGVGAACAWGKKGQLASSCSLQTACCHALSLAGTDSLSSEDWKEKAETACRVMASLLSSPALPLLPPALWAKAAVLSEGWECVSDRA